jgi:hypothetical protein
MPRGRDVIVPDIVDGIKEVVIKHTKTRRGTVRTTETVVPVLRPQREKFKQPSKSGKKGKQARTQPDNAEGSHRPSLTTDIPQIDPYTDEQEHDLFNAAEGTPLQHTVCTCFLQVG